MAIDMAEVVREEEQAEMAAAEMALAHGMTMVLLEEQTILVVVLVEIITMMAAILKAV